MGFGRLLKILAIVALLSSLPTLGNNWSQPSYYCFLHK
jgi:hypothetical protein